MKKMILTKEDWESNLRRGKEYRSAIQEYEQRVSLSQRLPSCSSEQACKLKEDFLNRPLSLKYLILDFYRRYLKLQLKQLFCIHNYKYFYGDVKMCKKCYKHGS